MQQRQITVPVRKSETMQVEGVNRTRRRPKSTWGEVLRKYTGACDLMADVALG